MSHKLAPLDCIPLFLVLINEMAHNEDTGEMFVTTKTVLEKGAQFGETALLLNNVRNATVVAQSDVELLVIAKQVTIKYIFFNVDSEISYVLGLVIS